MKRDLCIARNFFAFATLLLCSVAALFPLAVQSTERAKPRFQAPRIDKAYTAELGQLPDWNGRWRPTAPQPRPAEIIFDPENFYSPPDPSQSGDEGAALVGPLEGTYLTGIPYNKEWRLKYQHNVQEALAGRAVDRVAICEPYGFPRVMGGNPSGPEIIITAEFVLMYFDAGSAVRHIYTDGRGHPKDEGFDNDVQLRWNGHSIGRWEGDTLIVDTIGIYPSNYDQTAAPHSDQLHVTERIRLVEKDRLEVVMTMVDPIAFTRPWTVTRYFKRDADKYPNVSDHSCAPDEFIEMSQGYQRIVLPQEQEAEEGARSKP